MLGEALAVHTSCTTVQSGRELFDSIYNNGRARFGYIRGFRLPSHFYLFTYGHAVPGGVRASMTQLNMARDRNLEFGYRIHMCISAYGIYGPGRLFLVGLKLCSVNR